jgi:hypothetical protein
LDPWIHYFKNNEIQDGFNAKGRDKAKELWRVDNLSDGERQKYMKHIEDLRYGASMAWAVKIYAENKIRKEEKLQNAKGMKIKNIEFSFISELTGLTKEGIERF